MKAALLICDHVDPELQSTFGDYTDMFRALFPEFEWYHYDCVNGVFPVDLDQHNVYFITGSRHSAYEQLPWINRLKALVKTLYLRDDYVFGVCFGHQLIAEALGGKVERSTKGWCVGVHEFEVKGTMAWMVPQRMKINLLMMCQDQVTVLPKGAKVLAGNKQCPVGMYQIGDRILTVQAHPEFPKAYDKILMETRRSRMGDTTVDLGLKSLELSVDKELFRHWVLQFLVRG